MRHNDYNSFFKNLAQQHRDIRHEQPVSEGSAQKRLSFFRSRNELQEKYNAASFPCLVLDEYRGNINYDSHAWDRMTATLMFLQKVPDATDEAAIGTAKDKCKEIGFEFMAKLQRLMDTQGHNAPMPGFELNSVQYDFIGPLVDNLYGVTVFFQFGNTAFNPYTKDLDTIFIEEEP